MIFLRFRFRFRFPSFLALLLILFSFLRFLGSPSSISKPSSSSSSAILFGSSKKSSSRNLSFSSITALRLFSSTFLTAAENLLFLPPWRVFGTALDINIILQYITMLQIYSLTSILFHILIFSSYFAFSKLTIQSPSGLAAIFATKYGDKGVPYSLANYGIVPYGKTIVGRVGVPSVLEDCAYEEIPSLQDAQILMAQRGDCTFTQKSLNIQKEGGRLALIMDSIVQQPNSIVMVDDGRGFQITIPTILISQQDGATILDQIQKGVVLSIKFEAAAREKAHLDLWIDFTDHKNIVFLRQFQPYYNRIASHLRTKVKYPISTCNYDCNLNHCLNFEEKEGQNSQIYCRFPKPQDWLVQNGGKMIIEEQIFRDILFRDNSDGWWNYSLKFDETCQALVDYRQCRQEVSRELKIDIEHINGHVQNILNNNDRSEQALLNYWQKQRNQHGIVYYPSVVVNQIVYRGNLEPVDVFGLICESLTPQPPGCKGNQDEQQLSLGLVIGLTVFLGVIFVLYLFFCFRKMARRQAANSMHGHINSLVQEYITMYEAGKFEGEERETQLKDKIIDN